MWHERILRRRHSLCKCSLVYTPLRPSEKTSDSKYRTGGEQTDKQGPGQTQVANTVRRGDSSARPHHSFGLCHSPPAWREEDVGPVPHSDCTRNATATESRGDHTHLSRADWAQSGPLNTQARAGRTAATAGGKDAPRSGTGEGRPRPAPAKAEVEAERSGKRETENRMSGTRTPITRVQTLLLCTEQSRDSTSRLRGLMSSAILQDMRSTYRKIMNLAAWRTLVTPALGGAETGGQQVQAPSGRLSDLARPYLKKLNEKLAEKKVMNVILFLTDKNKIKPNT